MDSKDTLAYYFLLRQLTQQHGTGVFFFFSMYTQWWWIMKSEQQRIGWREAAHKLMILQILDELDLNIINLKRPEKQMLLLCPAAYSLQKGNITKRRKKEKKKKGKAL